MHHAYSQEGQLKRLDRSVPCCECRFGVLEQSIQSERGERGGQVPRDERERGPREREGKRDLEVITGAGDQSRHQTNNPSKEPISLSFYPGPICSGVGLKKKKKKKYGIRESLGFLPGWVYGESIT
jgi:hypothetical protein